MVEPVYAKLEDIPFPVDIVNAFRAPNHVPDIVDSCIPLKYPAIWLQEGVVNETAALRARGAGLTAIMDRRIYKYHVELMV